MSCVEVFTKFFTSNSLESMVFAAPIPVLPMDLYLLVIMNYKGQTMLADEARNQTTQQAKVEDV